ncbi:hypothetical protein T11_18598 [Trichinella zimbabwensis]|uniref:Uncharacterized protein n=1 Tax=Trichinella zimbabwensis TaxID=268475 RepID=A0A0V1GR17_9BILA|nr:hypothetical protein T11_18598 [Trichinella zimbabwensis]
MSLRQGDGKVFVPACADAALCYKMSIFRTRKIIRQNRESAFGKLNACPSVGCNELEASLQKQQQPEQRKSIFTKPEEALREKSTPLHR